MEKVILKELKNIKLLFRILTKNFHQEIGAASITIEHFKETPKYIKL